LKAITQLAHHGMIFVPFNLKLWKIILCGKFSAFWAGGKKKKPPPPPLIFRDLFSKAMHFLCILTYFFNFWGSFFGQFPTVLTNCHKLNA
jgi:hypothetical protein